MRIPAIAASIVCAAVVMAPAPSTHARPMSSGQDHVAVAPSAGHPRSVISGSGTPATKPVRRPVFAISYVKVVLSEQQAYFFNAGRRLMATVPVSTGLDETTPTGSFRVFSKSESAFYAPDPSEKMRWMTRFTRGFGGGNIGFHSIPFHVIDGTEVPSPTPLGVAPSSHGCIRVSNSDAQWIFANIDIGTRVAVVASR